MNFKEARSKSAFPRRDYDSQGNNMVNLGNTVNIGNTGNVAYRPGHEKTYSAMLKEKIEVKRKSLFISRSGFTAIKGSLW